MRLDRVRSQIFGTVFDPEREVEGRPLAGIIIAIMQGSPGRLGTRLAEISRSLEEWANGHNPFYNGAYADLLAFLVFLVLAFLLYLVGRDKLLVVKPTHGKSG